jgi:hypothetical protein
VSTARTVPGRLAALLLDDRTQLATLDASLLTCLVEEKYLGGLWEFRFRTIDKIPKFIQSFSLGGCFRPGIMKQILKTHAKSIYPFPLILGYVVDFLQFITDGILGFLQFITDGILGFLQFITDGILVFLYLENKVYHLVVKRGHLREQCLEPNLIAFVQSKNGG